MGKNTSNPQWWWSGGACWPNKADAIPSNWDYPYAFKSLADLLLYFEITCTEFGQPYSMDGASTSLVIGVSADAVASGSFCLYMSPQHASQYWYYLLNNWGCSPPLGVGPVISASEAQKIGASYVGIGSAKFGVENFMAGSAPKVTLIA
jgi:hypothetical protein